MPYVRIRWVAPVRADLRELHSHYHTHSRCAPGHLADLPLILGMEMTETAVARRVVLPHDTAQQHDLRAEPGLLQTLLTQGRPWRVVRRASRKVTIPSYAEVAITGAPK